MSKRSRDKGKAGEREAGHFLRRWFPEAKRGRSQSRGAEDSDVVATPGLWVEVKRRKEFVGNAWLLQAQRDAGNAALPVVMARCDRGEWLVMLRAEDFFEMNHKLKGGQ